MNGEQAQLFQQLLEEACDHFIDEGGKVITKVFNDRTGGQCPLTCLFGTINTEDMTKELKSMVDATVSYEELWTFISAFDGIELLDYQKKYVSMLLIAKELREKYLGVTT